MFEMGVFFSFNEGKKKKKRTKNPWISMPNFAEIGTSTNFHRDYSIVAFQTANW